MKYFAAIASLVSVLPHIAAVTIDTPTNVVQCQPSMLTCSGTGPFFFAIIPGGEPNAQPLETFPRQDAQTLTWLVDLAAGTSVTFQVKDSTGAIAYSDKVTIQNSDDSSCIKSEASSPPTAPSSNTPGTTTTPVGGTTKTLPAAATSSGANRLPAASASSQQSTAVATTTVRPVAGIQAVSSSTSLPAPTVASSAAKSVFSLGNLGMAAVVTLFGALFL